MLQVRHIVPYPQFCPAIFKWMHVQLSVRSVLQLLLPWACERSLGSEGRNKRGTKNRALSHDLQQDTTLQCLITHAPSKWTWPSWPCIWNVFPQLRVLFRAEYENNLLWSILHVQLTLARLPYWVQRELHLWHWQLASSSTYLTNWLVSIPSITLW